MSGRFITFEGIDGAGKSTHLEWAEAWLGQQGLGVVITREPGGTPVGEAIRALLLNPGSEMLAETEALLVFAARYEHIQTVIRPALDAGHWVLCDRFTDATLAYQGGGRGVDRDRLLALGQWVQGSLQPDRTFLFDASIGVAQARMAGRDAADRFESEAAQFHQRVRQAYLDLAGEHSRRFRIIDSTRSIDMIRETLVQQLTELLEETP